MTASLKAAGQSVDLVFKLLAEESSTSITARIGNGATGSYSGAITGTINATVVFDSATLEAMRSPLQVGVFFLVTSLLTFREMYLCPDLGSLRFRDSDKQN